MTVEILTGFLANLVIWSVAALAFLVGRVYEQLRYLQGREK